MNVVCRMSRKSQDIFNQSRPSIQARVAVVVNFLIRPDLTLTEQIPVPGAIPCNASITSEDIASPRGTASMTNTSDDAALQRTLDFLKLVQALLVQTVNVGVHYVVFVWLGPTVLSGTHLAWWVEVVVGVDVVARDAVEDFVEMLTHGSQMSRRVVHHALNLIVEERAGVDDRAVLGVGAHDTVVGHVNEAIQTEHEGTGRRAGDADGGLLRVLEWRL